MSVDLTDSSMAPGGRGYQRFVTGLRSRLKLKTDFLLSHPGEIHLHVLIHHMDMKRDMSFIKADYHP